MSDAVFVYWKRGNPPHETSGLPRVVKIDSEPQIERPPSHGHIRHVGTCPSCQRAQLARWQLQLAEASGARSGR